MLTPLMATHSPVDHIKSRLAEATHMVHSEGELGHNGLNRSLLAQYSLVMGGGCIVKYRDIILDEISYCIDNIAI